MPPVGKSHQVDEPAEAVPKYEIEIVALSKIPSSEKSSLSKTVNFQVPGAVSPIKPLKASFGLYEPETKS